MKPSFSYGGPKSPCPVKKRKREHKEQSLLQEHNLLLEEIAAINAKPWSILKKDPECTLGSLPNSLYREGLLHQGSACIENCWLPVPLRFLEPLYSYCSFQVPIGTPC